MRLLKPDCLREEQVRNFQKCYGTVQQFANSQNANRLFLSLSLIK